MTTPDTKKFEHKTPTWCPGCGDFAVWRSLKIALAAKKKEPHECVIVFDIGCSGNMDDKIKVYGFHGLHGRALPLAAGIKLANHHLPVIVVAGDGGGYGEGLNHFLHTIRGNHDLTYVIHDNAVYGLTKGQTAPTSPEGFKSSTTPTGVHEQPINGVALALTAGATFVARGFAAEGDHLTDLMMKAMDHRGFALLDVYQPCVTFNHLNTYEWFRQRVYKLEERKHDPTNREQALLTAMKAGDELPIGIFYQKEDRPSFHEQEASLAAGTLVDAPLDVASIAELTEEYF